MSQEVFTPNNITTDSFLSELPLSLLKENIKAQFKEPLEHKTDYVTMFIDKYYYFMDSLSEETEEENMSYEQATSELQSLRDDFISFMEKRFYKRLNIGMVDFESLSEDDQNETIKMLYSYFMINIKKNFTNLMINYIAKYKKSILAAVNKTKKKDVTTLSLKKEVTSQDDIDIIANLSEIINIVLDADINVTEFIEMTQSNKNQLECEWLLEAYDQVKITGNFVDKYKAIINNTFKYDLEISVRHKILKKYREI